MCGIVGYIGSGQAAPILLDGLRRLEYRGYDSAGLAVYSDGKIHVEKAAGKLEVLNGRIGGGKTVDGTVGIGHTRWATHGKPTDVNAHPHSSARFSLVHNGIIENEEELKGKFLAGVPFASDTDTEVIAHMLQKFTGEGESVEIAIKHAMTEMEGSYALAILDAQNPGVLYAAKNKSPLLIGKGGDFNMVGSDAMAMIAHTKCFYEIEDKEFAVISAKEVRIYTIYGTEVTRAPYMAEIDVEDAEKGAYPHYMLKEIEEQPFVIRKIVQQYSDGKGRLKVDKRILEDLSGCDKIYIIACGTSYHAGVVGKQFFERISGRMTEVVIASEFVHNTPLLSERPLFIFISQSGETADCRAVLVKVKEMGRRSLAITNVKGSTLAREADHALYLCAGPEIAVASTKAYTAQAAVLAILAAAVNNGIGIDIARELGRIARVIESICNGKAKIQQLAQDYLGTTRCCFYIGRSVDYLVCLEAALKLKEISYIQTEGFAAGELKHGTIALVEKGTPVIAVITQDNINLNTRGNIKEVKSRGAKVLTISTQSLSSAKDAIVIPDVNELLAPLAAIVPAQYLAYYAALYRGCDIDKPRNLAKSVTVE